MAFFIILFSCHFPVLHLLAFCTRAKYLHILFSLSELFLPSVCLCWYYILITSFHFSFILCLFVLIYHPLHYILQHFVKLLILLSSQLFILSVVFPSLYHFLFYFLTHFCTSFWLFLPLWCSFIRYILLQNTCFHHVLLSLTWCCPILFFPYTIQADSITLLRFAVRESPIPSPFPSRV